MGFCLDQSCLIYDKVSDLWQCFDLKEFTMHATQSVWIAKHCALEKDLENRLEFVSDIRRARIFSQDKHGWQDSDFSFTYFLVSSTEFNTQKVLN